MNVDMFDFNTLASTNAPNEPRIGKIICKSARLETPCLIASTSRGVIPHVSQDLVESSTIVRGAYVALEDLIEKGVANAPVLSRQLPVHNGSRLRSFISFPDDNILVLGARRPLPVASPKSNTNNGISICTSVGFDELSADEFTEATQNLCPDVVVGLGDIAHGEAAGLRRRDIMFSRTEHWMKDLTSDLTTSTCDTGAHPAVFAPVLPVDVEQQKWYLDLLSDSLGTAVAGLAIYDSSTAIDLPQNLSQLPRLSLTGLARPIQLLNEVAMGIDMFTVPFIGLATDAGIALDFQYRLRDGRGLHEQRPLGIDMWLAAHAIDLAPLVPGCPCYACTKHSRAYIQHLLSAKEMLAWVLLQIHNHQVMHDFFKAIRSSITAGTFSQQHEEFARAYEKDLPEKTGAGPRVRGYHFKSEGPGEPKRNAPAFVPFARP